MKVNHHKTPQKAKKRPSKSLERTPKVLSTPNLQKLPNTQLGQEFYLNIHIENPEKLSKSQSKNGHRNAAFVYTKCFTKKLLRTMGTGGKFTV